ncbi:hypothetical protein [Parasegetibacter sp. NRK P23]|uniref:hypothetical protein n=1 Tax=Parasegetibacter sp. NRK P23 TaxID=2942999 RepID=UPI002043B224|nr:hypothetical protein [Parasegetibacter sp. NRK P23]MCM5529113.1 hypothetical protein [Parasegetibacter sp. NRK P23]
MKTGLTIVCGFFMLLSTAAAQTLGEFAPKEQRGTYGPRKFPSKDVYIAGFSVNFQLYNLKTTSTKGGFAGKMLTGDTKASLAVGLDIPAATLQQITDDAYQQFVADLKAKGFNVIGADAAATTKYFEGYQRFDNMEMSLSEAPGMVTVYPSNTTFFVKGFSKNGQKKRQGMFSFIGLADRADEVASYPKLSQELNDAIIVNADLFVLFLDIKKPYQGDGARLIANTDLRLSSYGTVDSRVATNTNSKSLTNKIGLTSPGSKEVSVGTTSAIDFVAGRNKIGGSPFGTYTGVLKKDLQINGVIGQEKIQAFAKTDQDYIGTETAFGKMYRADNIAVENTALIKADPAMYAGGVSQAINAFLKHHVNAFQTKFFK